MKNRFLLRRFKNPALRAGMKAALVCLPVGRRLGIKARIGFISLIVLSLFFIATNNLAASEKELNYAKEQAVYVGTHNEDKLEKEIRLFEENMKKEKRRDREQQIKILREQEEAVLRQAKIKAREEDEARKKLKRLEEAKKAEDAKQVKINARKEDEARKKASAREEIAQLNKKNEPQVKARQEKEARRQEELEAKQAKIKAREGDEARKKLKRLEGAKKAEDAKQARLKALEENKVKEKRLKLEQDRQAQEELARQKQEDLEEAAQRRQERLEELAQERERKNEEFRIRQEEFIQQQQDRIAKLAFKRQQKQADLLARQQELVELKIERQTEEAELEAQREEQKQEQLIFVQKQLDIQKQQMQEKIDEAKKASAEEKIAAELKLKKQKEDRAKIEEIAAELKLKKQAEIRIKKENEILLKDKNEPPKQEIKIINSKGLASFGQRPAGVKHVSLAEPGAEKEWDSLVEPTAVIKKMMASRITMDFDRVGLKSVLTFLTQESGVNFVASQKVLENEPLISLRLKDAAADEAISCITRNLGLIYRINKDSVWIATVAEIVGEPMETRLYYLNKRGVLAAKSGLKSLGVPEKAEESDPAQIFLIEDTLKELVPWPAGSKIYYDKRINALFAKNTPANLQKLEDILYNTR